MTIARVRAREQLLTDTTLGERSLQVNLCDMLEKPVQIFERLATGASPTRPVAYGVPKSVVLLSIVLLKNRLVGGAEDDVAGDVEWASARDSGCHLHWVGGGTRKSCWCRRKCRACSVRSRSLAVLQCLAIAGVSGLSCNAEQCFNVLDLLE